MDKQVPGLPNAAQGAERERLAKAQEEALAAIASYETARAKARKARKEAESKITRYEELIAEHHGQLRLWEN